MDKLFSGLENLGFKEINTKNLYEAEDDKNNLEEKAAKKTVSIGDLLYNKSYSCPVCGNNFTSRAVKVGKTRVVSSDSDLMPRYENLNPLFYDVILCPKCGYAALIKYFEKIKQDQIELINTLITPKFKARIYPEIYDIDIAIERYKLSLLNAVVKKAKASEKAYICLKLGWMYKLKEDTKNEKTFQEQAFIGFKEAFSKEVHPICGMDSFTVMYLLGELSRRLGDNVEALRWLGNVIVAPNANPRLKEKARDQKDIIRANS